MRLKSKIAIVTGATSGIGQAVALAYAKEGADIVAVGRNEANLKAIEQQIQETGRRCLAVKADLCNLPDVKRVVDEAINTMGRVDVLVNCAGVFELSGFLECSEASFDHTLNINLKGLFFMTQAVAGQMKKQGHGGRIISFSSVAGGAIGFSGASVYCASKGAIVALTQALAAEFAPDNITVNAICPATIKTNMNVDLMEDPGFRDAVVGSTPLGRVGETDDITPAAVYLASDESRYMTGAKMMIDGGVSCV